MGDSHDQERSWCPCADCLDFREAVHEELRKARFELMFTLITGDTPTDDPLRDVPGTRHPNARNPTV